MNEIILSFIPIFVAMDAIGVLPLFVALTHQWKRPALKKVIFQSLGTALFLAFGFVLLGKMLFRVLGITVGDFMVAGGIILFCIAIIDIIQPGKMRRMPPEELGPVPLGTPLIVGPAVLTTSLILVDTYGIIPTLISIVLNIAITGTLFLQAGNVMKLLGQSGSRALSKVMALLLAAIAIMMVRKGLAQIFL
ncbi:MAG TPA: MarC family protein [Candidatus Omnitrophota bacterium]|nr:MarC family protein [Candidatus Omnitrophota bacterium]